MAEFTKERIIEEIKSSTQNASGMFEISEDTICALMSMLADKPSPAYVPDEIPEPDTARMFFTDAVVAIAKVQGWNACRAAMLHSAEPVRQTYKLNELSGNSPVTPDGWVMVPKRLTIENGAKGALSGEFSETVFTNCPECFGDDDCETCDCSGRIEIKVPVSWTTIKTIWAKGCEHFSIVAPQQDGG
ncbi:TPA: hypothetical protein JLR10_000945 [Escherichia coli]|nr:hypothetical protein [Escherichia coli]HAW8164464.1 hypothetical protein [Escherichia coli]